MGVLGGRPNLSLKMVYGIERLILILIRLNRINEYDDLILC